MWIALGLIAALWVVGAVIAPDKNEPPSRGQASATQTAAQAPPPAPHD